MRRCRACCWRRPPLRIVGHFSCQLCRSPFALQAHEEVLRLLLAAAPRLDAMELSNYLTRTLNNSK